LQQVNKACSKSIKPAADQQEDLKQINSKTCRKSKTKHSGSQHQVSIKSASSQHQVSIKSASSQHQASIKPASSQLQANLKSANRSNSTTN